jgi:hypothetical protein
MMLAARALARIVAFALLVVLALLGLTVAVFCLQGGRTGLSLPALAQHLSLPAARESVGGFLGRLEGPGAIDVIAVLGGLASIVLGGLLLAGLLGSRRERLVVLDDDDAAAGRTAARRRALSQAAAALAEQAGDVTAAQVRVRPGRKRGGRLAVRVAHRRGSSADQARGQTTAALAPLTDVPALSARISARTAEPGARVS